MSLSWNDQAYGVAGAAIILPPGAVTPFQIVSPGSVPDLAVGDAMDPIVFTSSGGVGAKTWTCVSGLPSGLTFTDFGDTGILAGTPDVAANYTTTFRATDTTAAYTEVTFSIATVGGTTGSAWPIQTQGELGITINGGVSFATSMYGALTGVQGPPATLGKAEWKWSKILCQWNSIESNGNHSYNWGGIQDKSEWCQSHRIRPIYNFTFCPGPYSIRPTATANRFVKASRRVYFPVSGAGQLGEGNWNGIHISDAGTILPVGTKVESNGGTDALGRYLVVTAVNADSTASNVCTFGPAGVPPNTVDMKMAVADGHLDDLARVVANLVSQPWAANCAIFYLNEANANGFVPPGMGVSGFPDRYVTALRYVYRAVKEFDPNIPVSTSGFASQPTTGAWNYRPEDFMRQIWRLMKSDTTWKTWIHATTPLVNQTTSPGTANHTMASLLASGIIDDDFFVDWVGYDSYLWNRKSSPSGLGADNTLRWDNANAAESVPERLMSMLNDMHKADPVTLIISGSPANAATFKLGVNVYTTGDAAGSTVATGNITYNSTTAATTASSIQSAMNTALTTGSCTVRAITTKKFKIYFAGALTNTDAKVSDRNVVVTVNTQITGGTVTVTRVGINRMGFLMPECGCGWHPEARTGTGLAYLGFDPATYSEEEAYLSFTAMKRILAKDVAYPTGGGIPAKLFTADVRDRLAVFNIQWLVEDSDGPYAAGDHFAFVGFHAAETLGSIAKGELKRTKTPDQRPYLGDAPYTDAEWGSEVNGADAVDAISRHWP